jgi:hypothetical protein
MTRGPVERNSDHCGQSRGAGGVGGTHRRGVLRGEGEGSLEPQLPHLRTSRLVVVRLAESPEKSRPRGACDPENPRPPRPRFGPESPITSKGRSLHGSWSRRDQSGAVLGPPLRRTLWRLTDQGRGLRSGFAHGQRVARRAVNRDLSPMLHLAPSDS